MAKINVYLTFNGNCEKAFQFYKSVFGGDFAYIGRFGEMPPQEGKPVSKEDNNLIMHVSLPVSKETILMGSDTTSEYGPVTFGNNFSVSINAENKAEADSLFKKLSSGGKISMPMSDTFWGAYFGMLVDQFGINWMINFDIQPVEDKVSQSKTTEAQV